MSNLINLSVYLNNYLVGHLTRLTGDRLHFYFTQEYLSDAQRPILSQSFFTKEKTLRADLLPTQTTAPPFFANLLPEGFLREYLAAQAKLNPIHDFYLLQLLGNDLPGAIRIKTENDQLLEQINQQEKMIAQDVKDKTILKFSLAGVQLKFSALLQKGRHLTIPAHGQGGDWIIKLPSERFKYLPENEFSMLSLAKEIGIDVPEIKLVDAKSIDNLPSIGTISKDKIFAIKRFDRGVHSRVHIEDFAQVYNVYPHEKYKKVSYNNILSMLSTIMGETGAYEFIKRLVFNILIGNSDMHLKNNSLIYSDIRTPQLAPAYDYVATHVFLDDNKMGLSLLSEKNLTKINTELFKKVAEKAKLSQEAVIHMVTETVENTVNAWHKLKSDFPLTKNMATAIEHRLIKTAKQFS